MPPRMSAENVSEDCQYLGVVLGTGPKIMRLVARYQDLVAVTGL